ncbi:calcium-binding protein [Litorivicinus lipolyticus]|uniref:Calcium-binding protein n=1 Tax=Litorivicinus lipolyticus TaxID=418701 RepID=A0A5Q2Q8F2_9GAMM|nr:calcium-binding protein [Litorivicinus lipolyticus]QGG79064.1 calcium-binding protein [Litorivicinus lipolyticus]
MLHRHTAIALALALVTHNAIAGAHAGLSTIGTTTAVMSEASTADDASERLDGQSGDQDYPYLSAIKALATVGEVDQATGLALTGYPDGQAAWLLDDDTVRVVYQSESYATMSNETYGWPMKNGTRFTGSHIHAIDYDRAGLSTFLTNGNSAAGLVKGSSHLFDTVYNAFGVAVTADGVWGNQALADGTRVNFNAEHALTEGDFFFQSFCGAFYEPAYKYGAGLGFADDLWLTAEEWNIQRMFEGTGVDAHDTMGLASVVVDLATKTAYTVPALGQSGYEKILPINPKHPDYVVLVMAGYNHGIEPTPLRIYVGKKGLDAQGNPVGAGANARDQFLARNGLLYGKLYGMAVANADYAGLGIRNINTDDKMLDDYLTDASAPDRFNAKFFATSYQWQGWDAPVSVRDTEAFKWQAASEQPAGYTFFVGDSKTEHPAVDPNIANQRYVQNMTNKGGMIGVELTDFVAAVADGDLPQALSAKVTRILAAHDGALSLDVADKGIKHGNQGTHATAKDGTAQMVAPDGLQWVRTADADVLIVDEDSGNEFGERKYALVLDADKFELAQPKGYFLAMAGGKQSPRAQAGVAAIPGAFKSATSSEFSGTWNVSALLARKANGTFYTADELKGTGEARINASIGLNDSQFIGVLQHKGESAGQVGAVKADQGGQLLMFGLNLPASALN